MNGKQDKLSAGNNITIDGDTISSNSGGRITQADLDTKQDNLSSPSNILTSRIDASDKVVITGDTPVLILKDTHQRSGMVYMNSDRRYFLSGVPNSETWTQVNSQWAMYLQMNKNQALFGGDITLNTGNIQSSKFKIKQAGDVNSNNTVSYIVWRVCYYRWIQNLNH